MFDWKEVQVLSDSGSDHDHINEEYAMALSLGTYEKEIAPTYSIAILESPRPIPPKMVQ
jgi:hypothetical protein